MIAGRQGGRLWPVIVLAGAALLALVLRARVGEREGERVGERVGERDKPTPGASPATSRGSAAYELRLGLNLAADSALHAAADRYAAVVAERSHGRLRVTVFPDQQLGSDEQMLEMARAGTLDLLLTPTAKLSSDVPAMQYADLPFYFSDRAEVYAMLDGEPGQLLLGKLREVGLVGVTFWENGFKQFTANKPILDPGDFVGLRIRTMKSRLIMDQFSAMGAEPVPIDFATTRQALADGVVAGQENPLVAIVGKRIHEVQRHLTLSNHAWLGYVFSVSRKVYERLPEDDRGLLVDVARELSSWEREETARRESQFLATIRAAGVEVHELDEAQRRRFAEVLAPLVPRYGAEIGYDLLAKTEELRLEARLAHPKPGEAEPLVLGLDVDLSGDGKSAGAAILRGVELALAELAARGGLLGGRPLVLVARDNIHNPARGQANLEYFAKLPGLVAVMGGKDAGVIEAELEQIHALKVPYLIPWATARTLVETERSPSYCFRLSLNHDWIAPFLLRSAREHGRRVAAWLERSAMGRSSEASLRASMGSLGFEEVRIEWFNPGERDFRARLTELRASGVDALLLYANVDEATAVVQAMAELERPIPIVAHWSLTGGDFFERNRDALARVPLRFVQSALLDDRSAPARQAFERRYRARYGLTASAQLPAPGGTLQAYDLTHILGRAIALTKRGDRAELRAALERVPSLPGLIKVYAPPFTPSRHEALDPAVLRLARYDELGRIVAARREGAPP